MVSCVIEQAINLANEILRDVYKLDKRTNIERWTISKKQYIRDKINLSQLQDKYHERLVDAGFDLERGIKGNNREHLKTKELKKTTHYYENKTQIINKNLDKAINDLNEKMKTTKNTIFDKEYVKIKKETFDSMNKVIKETKKVVEFQPKIEQLFNEVNTFTKSHQTLEKENSNLKREVKSLVTRNQNLTAENNKLKIILMLNWRQLKSSLERYYNLVVNMQKKKLLLK